MASACLLRIQLHFTGCRSLKEKRRRLKGLRSRLGKTANLALCESGHQDAHQRSEWSLIAIATESAAVDRTLTQAERLLEETLDAQLLGAQREWLC